MASAKPVTVTLGGLTERAAARVRSGQYASMSEVLRDGLRALDQRDEMLDELMRARVRQVLADPQPVPFEDGVAWLRRQAAGRRAMRDE